jgi:hypothetical protein
MSCQLFLFERKSYKKNQKSLQDLSAISSQAEIWNHAPLPLVMFAHISQTFGGTTRRSGASQTFCALQTRYRRE